MSQFFKPFALKSVQSPEYNEVSNFLSFGSYKSGLDSTLYNFETNSFR